MWDQVEPHQCTARPSQTFTSTVAPAAYFGDNALLAKFYAGTPTSLSGRVTKNGQAIVLQVPRVTYKGGGNPAASGKNADVMLDLDGAASVDALTGAHVLLDRLYYVES